MIKNKLKTVAISFITAAAAMAFVGVLFINSASEPLLSSGWTSSGRLGVASSTPGATLSVLGDAGINILTVENVFKASHIIATSTISTRDGNNGIRLRDSDSDGCHRIRVNELGVISSVGINCDTGTLEAGGEDDFDSYSSGDLTGNNGGNGWSQSWQTEGPDTLDLVTSSCYFGNCIKGSGGTSMSNDRNFTASVSNGIISFKTKTITGSGATHVVRGRVASEAIAFTIQTRTDAPGNVIRLIGAATENLISYTSGTWHSIEVEFGTGGSGTCTANKVRARADKGPWSSCISYSNNGALEDVLIEYSDSASAEYWIDELEVHPG